MTISETINKRKSTRKFNMQELDPQTLSKIDSYAKTLTPLFPNIKTMYQFVTKEAIKNIIPVKAPHYIVISSESTNGYLMNVGFMFQQMDLFLQSIDLGACWLGMAKLVKKSDSDLPFVIVLAFGKAENLKLRTSISEFKRKTLEEIANITDPRLESCRLAPSSTNSQPWYFEVSNEKINVYRIALGVARAMMYDKMNQIDIGIALAHLLVTSANFSFYLEQGHEKADYIYMGTVNL